MKNPLIRLAGFALAALLNGQLQAQTVADNSAANAQSNNDLYTAGHSTTTAALARKTTVTREFTSENDLAVIDIRQGTVNYQVYVRKSPDGPWMLVDTKTGLRDGAQTENGTKDDVVVSHPDSYMLKIMLTADCSDCVEVEFRQ
jgi:hypothetical protein